MIDVELDGAACVQYHAALEGIAALLGQPAQAAAVGGRDGGSRLHFHAPDIAPRVMTSSTST